MLGISGRQVAWQSNLKKTNEPGSDSGTTKSGSDAGEVGTQSNDAAGHSDTASFSEFFSKQQREKFLSEISPDVVEQGGASQQELSGFKTPELETGLAATLPPKVEIGIEKQIELAIDRHLQSSKLSSEDAQNFKRDTTLLLNTPSVRKFLENGKLHIDTAVSTRHSCLENLSHPCLDKYLTNGKIHNIDQALYASERQISVLSKPGVQKYIDSGHLSIELAMTLTEREGDALSDPGLQKMIGSKVDGIKVSMDELFRGGDDVEYLTEPVIQRFIFSGQMTTRQALDLRSTGQLEFLTANENQKMNLSSVKGNVLEHIAIHELLTTGKNTSDFEPVLSTNQKAIFLNPAVKFLIGAARLTTAEALKLSDKQLQLLSNVCIKHDIIAGKLKIDQLPDIEQDDENIPRLLHPDIQKHIISGRTSVAQIMGASEGEFQLLWSHLNKTR